MTPVKFVIYGNPVVQKNSKSIGRKKSKSGDLVPFIMSNKGVQGWRAEALKQLQEQWSGRAPIEGVELNAAIVSYLGSRQHPDADGLLAAPLDALQQAGVLRNDYCVRRFDGSDRRRDVKNPRVEITLSEIEKGE